MSEQQQETLINQMRREASDDNRVRQQTEDQAFLEQQRQHAQKLEEAKARRAKANPESELSTDDALAILRKWKGIALKESQENPMTLENPAYNPRGTGKRNKYKDYSYLEGALSPGTAKEGALAWKVIDVLTKNIPAADRAVGALYGLVLGDAFGAPLEFLPVDSRLVPPPRDGTHAYPKGDYRLFPNNWLKNLKANPFRPSHAFFDKLQTSASKTSNSSAKERCDKKEILYLSEFNKFHLSRGQWTDDASMSLSLADSLLANPEGYHGGDCRIRYYNWWTCGVNNAFRFDDEREHTSSVGLGGNIANSLEELYRACGLHATKEKVPPVVMGRGEDAGNGSMMRLAPVPIRYAKDIVQSMKIAAESSKATHPGSDAEACCTFMAYFISKAVSSPKTNLNSNGTTLRSFMTQTITQYLQDIPSMGGMLSESSGMYKVRDVLQCKPRSEKEALWNWKRPVLPTEETLAARGESYNGHFVDPGYFGAYSIDGLCMSLWSMWQTNSDIAKAISEDVYAPEEIKANREKFVAEEVQRRGPDSFLSVLDRVINLRGDADTTGAIAGQMAGAFYGFQSILGNDENNSNNNLEQQQKEASNNNSREVCQFMMSCVRKWDPFSEIGLRALMLADDAGLL